MNISNVMLSTPPHENKKDRTGIDTNILQLLNTCFPRGPSGRSCERYGDSGLLISYSAGRTGKGTIPSARLAPIFRAEKVAYNVATYIMDDETFLPILWSLQITGTDRGVCRLQILMPTSPGQPGKVRTCTLYAKHNSLDTSPVCIIWRLAVWVRTARAALDQCPLSTTCCRTVILIFYVVRGNWIHENRHSTLRYYGTLPQVEKTTHLWQNRLHIILIYLKGKG